MLPEALWALRTCKNETIKFSSFELLYGSQEKYWICKFIKQFSWVKETINNIQTANQLWKNRRNQIKRKNANYQPADLILIRIINCKMLEPYFLGPLKVVKKTI
ncbi:hypothetical protein PIROE2DRAFT_12774 [Piromyces sp. E2]|nr:hypothetical protein PIROE2DRAFT_12774 [Piromyces sp. E2]|eukprot:OUM61276.1 hypothetical protein PIROE2DRAFT_12774 [Piromyces sp. E2]